MPIAQTSPEPLAQAKDHPVEILARISNESDNLLDETINPTWGTDSRTVAYDKADQTTVQDCINLLRLYEQGHGITFVALDNEALAEVRKFYRAVQERDNEAVSVAHLICEIGDLLGLND